METRFVIPLEEFPEEGLRLEGELDGAILGIEEADMRSTGPLHYEVEVQLYDTELVLRGTVSAPFRMRCVRCLEEFDYELVLDELTLSADVKDRLSIDLTDELREELVLELPAYPKCELVDEECKINDSFGDFRLAKDPQPGVDSATPSGESVWDALDSLPGQ